MDFVTPLITVTAGWISLVIGWKVLKRRIFSEIAQFGNDFIAAIMQDAIEHPEKLAPLIKAITDAGIKELGITKEQSIPGMKIGGLKIPGWLIQGALPLIQGQMKKGATEVVKEAAKSAFHA